jgi:hypothetical protein
MVPSFFEWVDQQPAIIRYLCYIPLLTGMSALIIAILVLCLLWDLLLEVLRSMRVASK